MSIDVTSLKTKEECDQAIDLANERKEELEYEQTVHGKELKDDNLSVQAAKARLIEVNAQITGTTAALAALPAGKYKDTVVSRLRRLNDRKDNLEDQLKNSGAAALIDAELGAKLLEIQVTEIDNFIADVSAHKATL